LRTLGLNERQIEALRLMTNERKTLTNTAYQQLFKVSRNTAVGDLQALIKTGSIKATGNGKSTHDEAL